MSWALIALLGAFSLAIRGAGFAMVNERGLTMRVERMLSLVALALLGAVIAVQSLTTQGQLALDARAVGLSAALLTSALGWPLVRIFLSATAATALSRAVAGVWA